MHHVDLVALRRRVAGLALLAVLALAPIASAQQVLTPEMIVTLRQATDAQVSPDGSRVLFQVARPRGESERPGGAVPEIWSVTSSGSEPVRFTFGANGDRIARWAPDGRRVAFLSQRPGSDFVQVQLIPANGGEASAVTSAENSVLQFKWSPDGSRIAYTVTDPKTKEERDAEAQGRDWTVADRNYKHIGLHVIDVQTKKATRVTTGPLSVHDFDWSPDGGRLLLMAADTPTIDDSFMRLKLLVVPAQGGEPQLLVKTEGKLSHPRWSPDGRSIAWLGATALNDPHPGSVFVMPVSGGTPQNLLKGYEGSAIWLAWQRGAATPTVIFGAIEKQDTAIYLLNPVDGRRTPLKSDALIMPAEPSFTADGRRMAAVVGTPARPNEVYFGAAAAGAAVTRLSNLNPQLDNVRLGEQSIFRWKASDGWDIEGVLVKPVDYKPGQRYPLVVQPHGGPESADLNNWNGTYLRWGQMLAGRGYATLYPNYRGSIGRGVAFSMADHRDLMGKEFQDTLAGIDALVQQGIADPARVGIGGFSYGGYTSAWAATYASERFKAAVMGAGISNLYSMTGTSDIFYESSTVHFDAIMYDNLELYWDRSPLKYIKKANTPLLIVHGAVDPRVPIGQSQEIYTALKWKGVPVEFVTYPREGHGFAERAHQLDYMQRVTQWFDKYLRGQAATNN